ncbi:dicarboxylate/amino acid:cation symporter, partial [Burkholderia pseudomallei]|nr:dicarboxylate/amino acid:cation symporter [Burkholderia pseudomallei]
VKEFYRCIGVVPVWRAQHLGLHSQALIFGECRGWLECRRRDSCVRNARVTNAATFARAKFKLMIGPA